MIVSVDIIEIILIISCVAGAAVSAWSLYSTRKKYYTEYIKSKDK